MIDLEYLLTSKKAQAHNIILTYMQIEQEVIVVQSVPGTSLTS